MPLLYVSTCGASTSGASTCEAILRSGSRLSNHNKTEMSGMLPSQDVGPGAWGWGRREGRGGGGV